MPVVVYSLLRAVLFIAVTGVLWWVGMRSWLAPVLGAVVAWGLSYVLLRRQRDAAAAHLARRVEQRRAGGPGARALEDAAAEDAAVDRAVPEGDARP